MKTKGFDSLTLHDDLLLSLPMSEGGGTILTQDVAKPHHPVTLVHAPVWTALGTSLQVLAFDGANDYMECAAADCVDLDFTAGDFSLACWCYWTGTSSDIVMARYKLDPTGADPSGWETYFDDTIPAVSLTLRFHHIAGGGSYRTGCYSTGWTKNTWWLMGISRSGAYPLMYRNGQGVTVTYDAGGLTDPRTSDDDLVIGTRFSKDTNFWTGQLWNPRIWGRNLAAAEHMAIFNRERHLFGV